MATPIPPSENEIVPNDNFELAVFKDSATGGIFVRMGNAETGTSIVVSGEALMHAAGVVEKSFDDKKNSAGSRSLN